MVDVRCNGPRHLGNPALRDLSEDGHLTETQMSMHQSEGESRVVIGFSDDEGDLMIVPVDGHRFFERQSRLRHRCQPVLHGGV